MLASIIFNIAPIASSYDSCGENESCPAEYKQESQFIPIIDLSKLFQDNKEEKLEIANKIGKACKEVGFFVITNHGVDTSIIENAWRATSSFFDLPTEEKLKLSPESQAGIYIYMY